MKSLPDKTQTSNPAATNGQAKKLLAEAPADRAARLQRIADNAPAELKEINRWVCYRLVPKPDGKLDKIPIDANTGYTGSSTDPATWGSFETALQYAHTHLNVYGVAIVLTADDLLVAVDLDKCVVDGDVAGWVMDILHTLHSYTEISPSGTGLRIFCYGKLPATGRKKGGVEMYENGRFMTVTGQHLPGKPKTINLRKSELITVHRQVFGEQVAQPVQAAPPPAAAQIDDQSLLDTMFTSKNGKAIRALWEGKTNRTHPEATPTNGQKEDDSPSIGDLALCRHLAFYTLKNAEQIDRLFRQSGRLRDKWNKPARAGQTYGQGTIKRAIDECTEVYTAPGTRLTTIIQQATQAEDQPIHETDLGNARRLVKQFGADLHYVYAWGKWFIWDGSRWAEDETGEIERIAKQAVANIYAEASQATSNDIRTTLGKWALASEAQSKISAMIALARSELGISIKHAELDGDPMLLNCRNGTIDLRTGNRLPHDRKHLATKRLDIDYDPTAECPLWQRFLQRIMADNQELIGFLQRAVGYSLTGSVIEQCLFFLFGTGSNGKTTFVEIIQSLLGAYAQKAPTEMIMLKQNTGGIPNDIARLPGARFVVTSEIEAGRRLAEALVKDLTGGDTQVARFMRQEYFEFTPTHKLWIFGNHKPTIKGSDNGIWRRINLVPFAVQIPDAEKDERLKEKLKAELAGILAWAVRGCLEWQRGGLRAPVEVKTATEAYRAESDALSNFIDECCMEGINLSCRFDQLYAAYKVWAERNGERTEGSRQFGNTMTDRGFLAEKGTAGARMRRGIGLIETKSEANK